MIQVKLLEIMVRAGIRSQAVLSKRSNISETTLSKVRRHHSFRHDTLDKLCHALDCSPADLLVYQKNEGPDK